MTLLYIAAGIGLLWLVTMGLGLLVAPDEEPWSRVWAWLRRR